MGVVGKFLLEHYAIYAVGINYAYFEHCDELGNFNQEFITVDTKAVKTQTDRHGREPGERLAAQGND